MILPTLRGYTFDLSRNTLTIECTSCRAERILYRRLPLRGRQRRFPAYCARCQDLVIVRLTVERRAPRERRRKVLRNTV